MAEVEFKTAECSAFTADIFIAGDYVVAKNICQAYCDEVGLCVHVMPCDYVFTGGNEAGVKVGLIRYPRFKPYPDEIRKHAEQLAFKLLTGLNQGSFTIQYPTFTVWYSRRGDKEGEKIILTL